MIKVCPICGKEFETEDGRVKYCSDNCRLKSAYYYQANYVAKRRAVDPDFRKARNATVTKWYDSKRDRYFLRHAKNIAELNDVNAIKEYLKNNFRVRHNND